MWASRFMEDMAGEGEQSWRSQLVAAGHDCFPVLKGIVEYDETIVRFINHISIIGTDLHIEDTLIKADLPG